MPVKTSNITRRTAMTAPAWAVPTVALALAAPARAASGCDPTVPGAPWPIADGIGGSPAPKTGVHLWQTSDQSMHWTSDAQFDTETVFATTSPSMAVLPGQTYGVTYPLVATSPASAGWTLALQYSDSTGTWITIGPTYSVTPTAGATTIVGGTTQQPGQPFSWTIPAGLASTTLRYVVTLWPTSNPSNQFNADGIVGIPRVTCS